MYNGLPCNINDALILGIDGGGTKTAFAVAKTDGYVLEYFTRGGSNPNDIGADETLALLSQGINEALSKYPSISAVFCGISGAATSGHSAFLEKELCSCFPEQKIALNSDFENIFGCCDGCDIAVISGTGSVVCVRKDGKYNMLGGWGHLFDKAGSAFDIGREAVFCALEEEELNKPHSLIAELLKERLGVEKIRDAVSSIYKGGKPYVASLANVVFDAYRCDDAAARKIIDDSAKRLSELLNTAVSRFDVSPQAVAGGGIFEHFGDIIFDRISNYTDVKITLPLCPPIYGACRNAMRMLGNVTESFEQNFTESFNSIRPIKE